MKTKIPRFRKRHATYLLILFLAVGLSGGIYYAYWSLYQYKFTAVTQGRVYRSAEIPPQRLGHWVKKYGIRTIIDFRKPGPDTKLEQQAAAESNVLYQNIHSEQIPSSIAISSFLKTMDQEKNFPVLIHCHHGTGRSVLFSAIYRIEFECWANETARKSTRFFTAFSSFAAGEKKGEFLKNYRSRLHRCRKIITSQNDITPK
jgi:hypothetical protein